MSTILSDFPKRIARKAHRCYYCGQSISAGEIHGYRTGVDGGDFWTMRHHPECDEYASKHWDEYDYECHFPGDMERPVAAAAIPAPRPMILDPQHYPEDKQFL